MGGLKLFADQPFWGNFFVCFKSSHLPMEGDLQTGRTQGEKNRKSLIKKTSVALLSLFYSSEYHAKAKSTQVLIRSCKEKELKE